jgi:hypothetical protein
MVQKEKNIKSFLRSNQESFKVVEEESNKDEVTRDTVTNLVVLNLDELL